MGRSLKLGGDQKLDGDLKLEGCSTRGKSIGDCNLEYAPRNEGFLMVVH